MSGLIIQAGLLTWPDLHNHVDLHNSGLTRGGRKWRILLNNSRALLTSSRSGPSTRSAVYERSLEHLNPV
jgi:hypothetical protein